MITAEPTKLEDCLADSTVRDLLAGRMPSEQYDQAMQHLEHCQHCRTRAESASIADSDTPWIPQSRVTDPSFANEQECVVAVNNLLVQSPILSTGSDCQSGHSVEQRFAFSQMNGYQILSPIGSGGMGTVYLAEHTRLQKRVAIKILSSEKAQRPGWLDRFNREMTSVAALEHPHVVRALDAGEWEGVHYLVMEYLEGHDLATIARNAQELSIASACEMIRQAAEGLHAIHVSGMVHRDIKPSNIFLTRDGVVKLLDLGLVLDGESPVAGEERLTTVGHLMGTLPYMSREQINDPSRVSDRADLYSLGATLFRLITGRVPLGSTADLPGTIQRITRDDCPSLADLRSELPRGLVQLVDQTLTHQVENRPGSAQEIANRLAPHCKGHDIKGIARRTQTAENSRQSVHTASGITSGKFHDDAGDRWRRLLIWTTIPLALVAGILITLVTDRGTLVIESSEDDVNVAVRRNETEVSRFTVSALSPKRMKLWSGPYEVTIEGEAMDRFQVDKQQVAIYRGQEEAVRISQRPEAQMQQIAQNPEENQHPPANTWSKTFRGEPFSHWLSVLAREQSTSTLFEAMEAVTLLADTEEQMQAATLGILKPARRLGNFTWSVPSPQSSPKSFQERSSLYMGSLREWFPKFPTKFQLQAIAQELSAGTARTDVACASLLADLRPQGVRQFLDENPKNSALLMDIVQELAQFVAESKAPPVISSVSDIPPQDRQAAAATALAGKIRLLICLDEGLERLQEDEQTVTWAFETYQQAKIVMNQWLDVQSAGAESGIPVVDATATSPLLLDPLTAVELYWALRESKIDDQRPIVLGLLSYYNSSLVANVETNELKRTFAELRASDAEACARATDMFLRSMVDAPRQFGGAPSLHPDLAASSLESLRMHPSPGRALMTLERVQFFLSASNTGMAGSPAPKVETTWPDGEGWRKADDTVVHLANRVFQETGTEDPLRLARLNLAARALYKHRAIKSTHISLLLRELDFPIQEKVAQSAFAFLWPSLQDTSLVGFPDQVELLRALREILRDFPQATVRATMQSRLPSRAVVSLAYLLHEALRNGEASGASDDAVEREKNALEQYLETRANEPEVLELLNLLSAHASDQTQDGNLFSIRAMSLETPDLASADATHSTIKFDGELYQVTRYTTVMMEAAKRLDCRMSEISTYQLLQAASRLAEIARVQPTEPVVAWRRDTRQLRMLVEFDPMPNELEWLIRLAPRDWQIPMPKK